MRLTFRQSQKGKTFGVWLGRWRGCSVKKVKVTSYIAQYPFLRKMCQLIKYHPAICAVLSIWYIGSLTSLPNKVETLKTMAYPFIWHIKPKALKMESLLNTFADGGLSIVDIRTKI